jgi:hypothetical protein
VALLPTISGRWMRQGQQTQVNTPGQNAKQYVFGAVNYVTGALIWLTWPNKNNVGFNPIERVWRHVRRNVTDNFYFGTLPRLMTAVKAFLAELAHSPTVILSIIA